MEVLKKIVKVIVVVFGLLFLVCFFLTDGRHFGIYFHSSFFIDARQMINILAPIVFIFGIILIKNEKAIDVIYKAFVVMLLIFSLLVSILIFFPLGRDIDITRNKVLVSSETKEKYVVRTVYQLRSAYLCIGKINCGFFYSYLGDIHSELGEGKIYIQNAEWENSDEILIYCHEESGCCEPSKDMKYRFNVINNTFESEIINPVKN